MAFFKRVPIRRKCSPEEFSAIKKSFRTRNSDLLAALNASATEKEKVDDDFISFLTDDNRFEWKLPASLPKQQRAKMHKWGDIFDLGHVSTGLGEERALTLSKPFTDDGCVIEYVVINHYVSLVGLAIDRAAERDSKVVPNELKSNRLRRDGPHFHITLCNSSLFEGLLDSKQVTADSLVQLITETLEDDWTDLGLGCVKNGGNSVYFKVISWPSGEALRERLGLPSIDFHITIGFQEKDIHGARKDSSTLLVYSSEIKE